MTSPKPKPFSLRIFLPDGTPDGLRIIEKSNWSGRGVVCPRALLPESKSRPDFGKAGVYVLNGPSESGDVPRVYIGEGDPVRPRLEQHFATKDFWTTAIFFVSKDENLNKAHIQHLESRLLQLAREAKRCELDNTSQPTLPTLSEMDAADAEGFLQEMLLCFPVLGLTIFEKPAGQAPSQTLFYLNTKGIEARGFESPQGFVVLKGSRAVATEARSIHSYLSQLRKSLMQLGILQVDGQSLILTQDYTFNSPSTAAGVMLGRSANGREEWKTRSGRTLKAVQADASSGPAV